MAHKLKGRISFLDNKKPVLAVKIDTVKIDSGYSYNFGNIEFGEVKSLEISVGNEGFLDLNISQVTFNDSGFLSLVNKNELHFTLSDFSAITLKKSHEIKVTLTYLPNIPGTHSTVLIVKSNDPVRETFIIKINAHAIAASRPKIRLRQGADLINPDSLYDFGLVAKGTSSYTKIFTIKNIGIPDLVLTDSPLVKIRGANAGEFSITQPNTSTITSGNSVFFTVTFNPVNTGPKSAIVTIASNDTDKNLYIINLAGTGSALFN